MPEELMNDDELDAEFRGLINAFIDQANNLNKQSSIENISLALLHAASRYNAYVVSRHASSLSEFESELDNARAFFNTNYQNMLNGNLEDYKKTFNDEYKYLHLMN